MKFPYQKLLLAVILLFCLLTAVVVIHRYSKSAAVLIWFLGNVFFSAVKLTKPQQLNQSQIQKLDVLDTEYAAIVAASRNAAGEAVYNPELIVKDIIRYRQSTRQSVKDILLYRLGSCLQLSSLADTAMIEQKNRRLNDEQRQRMIQLLSEQLGVSL